MSSTRALNRWAWKTLKKEWKSHILILLVTSLAALIGIVLSLGVFNLIAPDENTFGATGDAVYSFFEDVDQNRRSVVVQYGEDKSGFVNSVLVETPTFTTEVEVLSMDPEDEMTAPFIELLKGRWPEGADEIVVTDSWLESSTVSNSLDGSDFVELAGVDFSVVGVVENPTMLSSDFALTTEPLEELFSGDLRFATTAYIDTSETFLDEISGTDYFFRNQWDDVGDRNLVTLFVNAVFSVALLEVALVSIAIFTVVGQSRLRQYGLIAAIGASPKTVRRAALFHGLAIAVVSALVGTLLGLVVLQFGLPLFEELVNHRIDFSIPIWVLAMNVLLIILSTVFAAWWPANSLSKIPIVNALKAKLPKPRSSKSSGIAGLIVFCLGVAGLVVGFAEEISWFALPGIFASIIGTLLFAPGAVRLIGYVGKFLPMAGRISARDIFRHQSRSAAGLAAVIVVLALPISIVVTSSAVDADSAGRLPNLPANVLEVGPQQRLYLPPEDSDFLTLDSIQPVINRELPGAEIIEIQSVILTPDLEEFYSESTDNEFTFEAEPAGVGFVPLLTSTLPAGDGDPYNQSIDFDGEEARAFDTQVWVATPELLELFNLDIDLEEIDSEFIVSSDKQVQVGSGAFSIIFEDVETLEVEQLQVDRPNFRRISHTWITPDALANRGWEATKSGWLVVDPNPIPDGLVSELRQAAAGPQSSTAGVNASALFVNGQDVSDSSNLRLISTMAGSVTALAILALTISLIGVESKASFKTLHALGATPTTRRNIAGTGAFMLAMAAALLALPLGYLSLVAINASDSSLEYSVVFPVLELAIIVLVVPLTAGLVAWLLGRSGNRQRSLA